MKQTTTCGCGRSTTRKTCASAGVWGWTRSSAIVLQPCSTCWAATDNLGVARSAGGHATGRGNARQGGEQSLAQRAETVRAGVTTPTAWPTPMTTASTSDTGERPRTIRVPWAPSAVAKTRRVLVADLDARGVASETVGEAEIVVSELIANALRHARPLADGMVRVHWKVKAGVVEVEVSDGGGVSTPRPAPQSLWASSGRGLRIVRSLAHEWGVTEERNGRTVWAALGGPSRRRSH